MPRGALGRNGRATPEGFCLGSPPSAIDAREPAGPPFCSRHLPAFAPQVDRPEEHVKCSLLKATRRGYRRDIHASDDPQQKCDCEMHSTQAVGKPAFRQGWSARRSRDRADARAACHATDLPPDRYTDESAHDCHSGNYREDGDCLNNPDSGTCCHHCSQRDSGYEGQQRPLSDEFDHKARSLSSFPPNLTPRI